MRITLLALVALSALAIAGCSAAPTPLPVEPDPSSSPAAANLAGLWSLDGGTHRGENLDLGLWQPQVVFTEGKARLFGCAAVDQDMPRDLPVVTAAVAPSTASCAPFPAPLASAVDAFDEATRGIRDGDTLVLESGDYDLHFTLVPAATVADVVGSWTLDAVMSADIAAGIDGRATLDFSGDGTVTGSTGCRDFSGTYELESGATSFSELDFDDAPCQSTDPARRLDKAVRALFEEGFLLAVADRSLQLKPVFGEFDFIFAPAE